MGRVRIAQNLGLSVPCEKIKGTPGYTGYMDKKLIEFARKIAEDSGTRLTIDSDEPRFGFKDPDGFHPTYWYTTKQVRNRMKREGSITLIMEK